MTADQQRLRAEVAGDRVAVGSPGCILDVEGSEHRRFRRAAGDSVVDEIDEHRDPECVSEQDEFLAPLRAHLSNLGEKANARHQLRLGERLLDGELVQVADQAANQLTQPGIGAVLHAVDDLLRQVARGRDVICHVVAHS